MASRLQASLSAGNRRLAQLQEQAVTGERFVLPSESASAAVRTIFLQKTIERKAQMVTNIQTSRGILAATEIATQHVTDTLIQSKSIVLTTIGDTSSAEEKAAMQQQVTTMINGLLGTANSKYLDRYLFSGSEAGKIPFEVVNGGYVRYNGNQQTLNIFADFDQQVSSNVNGDAAFAATSLPVFADANPSVTLQTRLTDLHGGEGLQLGKILVTVDDGGPITREVDLTTAQTIGDVKARIEAAFSPGAITVGIVPGPPANGISLTPAVGTVTVADQTGARVAADLGIAGTGAAILGGDINPRLTLDTPLSAFNASGVGAATSNGLQITNGIKSQVVDISSASTVQDLFNLLESADLDLMMGISSDGKGLAIVSRLSGANFSIGENGGNDAASLGIRTFTEGTRLSDLNLGRGVDFSNQGRFDVTLSTGSTLTIDLTGAATIQDVISKINAAGGTDLSASLNAYGNGITLTESAGGTGDWQVEESPLTADLGIAGTRTAGAPLNGVDTNPRQAPGVFGLLVQLHTAISSGDTRTLEQLDSRIDIEIERFNLVRSDLGFRQKTLEDIDARLADEDLVLQQSLSEAFHVDMAEVLTQLTQLMATMEATLKISASTNQLTLLSYL